MTLNSTKYGEDFDSSHSQLRDDSDPGDGRQEELVEENIDAHESNKDNLKGHEEVKKGKDGNDEDMEDSLSGNSTGAKKKRKRNKKGATAKQRETAEKADAEDVGRETRSKKQAKQDNDIVNDAIKTSHTIETENKGEKEKRSYAAPASEPASGDQVGPETKGQEPAFPVVRKTAGDVAVFKTPKICSRLDIHRVVSKAVQQSKSKLSNNFAINSKIQRFQITTDCKDIKKFPAIDENASLTEIKIPEFIWAQEERTLEEDNMAMVKTKGVVQFIILARNGHIKDELWEAPGIDMVRNFASYITCTIAELKLDFGIVLRWTNPWGSVAVMGLDASDLGALLRFRTFCTTLRFQHHYFNTFPKDAMTNNYGLTILLRSDL